MTLWKLETRMGVGIRDYGTDDHDVARERAIREVGTMYFEGIEEASDDDVAWVRGMGGRVPRPPADQSSLGE